MTTHRNAMETVLGAVVLVVASVFLVFAYKTADLRPVKGYEVTARFSKLDGLKVGSDVRISGVKVGSVMTMTLDHDTYQANVDLSIDSSIRLPIDTMATVTSDGLLGEKFLSLEPGVEEDEIPPRGRIDNTQSAPGLEQLIGHFIYKSTSGTGK
ncbi:MAG TPA: outer membrane lipid asymmetry maintenance protein MlaD [Rhodospirillaceae bacterium]|nr:MAG: outer membrane lipid asymmetry maintenance protein MlaD [Alphaproteobacteria bacterium GWF2_58_20]HAU28645.1 outer membrane lipid asymmetry maintenance protein MlaD [Rhodospirillaceae bacterium]